MTDEKLIYNFLYRNFTPVFHNNKIGVHDKIYGKKLTSDEFSLMFSYIFDGYTTDNNETPYDLGAQWFYTEKKKLVVKLDEYLEKCDVILGDTNWVAVGPDKKEISDEDVLKVFEGEYDSDFILGYFDSWMMDKIIDVSESLMNKW